jgi:hypothetical protein
MISQKVENWLAVRLLVSLRLCSTELVLLQMVEASWNVMAHAQKQDIVFRRNGLVCLNRQERHFSRLLAADVCASAVVMLDTPCSEVVWRVLATYIIRQFPIHLPSRASPCAITFQLEPTARPSGVWLPLQLASLSSIKISLLNYTVCLYST